MGILNKLLFFVEKLGFWDVWRWMNPEKLTVLNYHRVCSPEDQQAFFKPNISAIPGEFIKQIEYIQKRYNVISAKLLGDWIAGNADLPKHAALITFDDGYLDNYENAYPELKKRGLSAIIFLTTDYIVSGNPAFWDLLAYCFQQTVCSSINIPEIGEFLWESESDLDRVILDVVQALKELPESRKKLVVSEIINLLDVRVEDSVFSKLFLTWDQVREMAENGIEMGAHTINHPILTRIPRDEAEREIRDSKNMIEAEIGSDVIAFAYPNGQETDFNLDIQRILEETNYLLGFSLISGPHNYRSLKQEKFTIKRIFLSYRDTLGRFVAKLHGLPKLFEIFGKGLG
jgi:peptidoglycan/xylan/chitin deacetylase (PgdA/CDA1 family)